MRLTILFAALFFFTVFSLFARDVEITIEDVDLNLPLEGAIIRSWDGKQYVCNKNGTALVFVPDERQVVIQAVYPGYETGRLIVTITSNAFTLGLRLSGIMEGRELVVEAAHPLSSETKTGRSVAVSGRDIAQTAEIGIIEDVINSIKLLPGVGYTGLFDAQPSIRGGDPGDMRASLDGFYIFNPYHWGGGFSIFDPRMIESAQLSHGVFSSRYGHSISGLLDITSKKPSPTETEVELGVNTSAANLNLSVPLSGKGGILFMGRVTYYDPVIMLAQEMSKTIDELEAVNSIRVAPYIRSATITGNYRFTDKLDFRATGFFGMDGIGVTYNEGDLESAQSTTSIVFDYTNYQTFFTSSLSWNPRNDMLVKFTAGTGYTDSAFDGDIQNSIGEKPYSDGFKEKYPYLQPFLQEKYDFFDKSIFIGSDTMFNVQGRIDYDWEIGGGFLIAAGAQEMYSRYATTGKQQILGEKWFLYLEEEEQEMIKTLFNLPDNIWRGLSVSRPITYTPDAENNLVTTSGYALAEYTTPANRFGAELGLRVDHFILTGKGISLQSQPSLNPRLNLDFNVFKNRGWVRSFDLSAGTGLFSSVNDTLFSAEEKYGITEIKPNRAWTSVLGARLEFPGSLIFNVEGYYKYVFDRMYVPIHIDANGVPEAHPQFDGTGRVWGIDLFLQKIQSRFMDGWITYSYSWAKYLDPNSGDSDMGISGGVRDGWYFPSYHRFHNLNLVLNIKPAPRMNVYTRFGLASGVQIVRRIGDRPESYPVFVYDPENPSKNYFIEKYLWRSVLDENNRTTPSLPMDIKFSIFGKKNSRKTRSEVYVAVENVLVLLYTSTGNTTFNAYTGEINPDGMAASYDIPIPIPSFGFKYSF